MMFKQVYFLTFSIRLLVVLVLLLGTSVSCWSQAESAREEDYFRILRVPSPEGVFLEVGGLAVFPNGNLAVATRRGDVFIIENPTSQKPHFTKFASGLHEVLGLVYKDGALYCTQRGELTKLVDQDHDGIADELETIYSWPLSGNYCEYNYLKLAPDGTFFVTCNLAFPEVEWWRPTSPVPWRGWTLHIDEKGNMEPWATGMRSPAGMGIHDGELFYADNQGDWIGSGGIVHLKKGVFTGNPAGLRWAGLPSSPVKLTQEQLFEKVSPRIKKDAQGRDIKPENIKNEDFTTLTELKKTLPTIQFPSVWLPHGILGISNSEIVNIPENTFGPFSGQMLIGDQGQSKIMRVFMEKVNGEYQGAAWDFKSGFQSGVLRLAWADDGSLFAGETNRGWGSAGEATMGLQRLVWNGRIPFEMKTVKAMPDGFEIEFTKPVDKKSAEDIGSYSVESFIYKYHPAYGSPPVDMEKCSVKGVKVSGDCMKVRLVVANLRKEYIHNINLEGVREQQTSYSLVHPTVYYTLNNIPEGQKLSAGELSTKNSASSPAKKVAPSNPVKGAIAKTATTANPPTTSKKMVTLAEVTPLLVKNTCNACHNAEKRQVGPAFKDVAKRNYSIDRIVQLIHNPEPQNWPGYSSPMPPMPHVPIEDARKIAAWINSLNK